MCLPFLTVVPLCVLPSKDESSSTLFHFAYKSLRKPFEGEALKGIPSTHHGRHFQKLSINGLGRWIFILPLSYSDLLRLYLLFCQWTP